MNGSAKNRYSFFYKKIRRRVFTRETAPRVESVRRGAPGEENLKREALWATTTTVDGDQSRRHISIELSRVGLFTSARSFIIIIILLFRFRLLLTEYSTLASSSSRDFLNGARESGIFSHQ